MEWCCPYLWCVFLSQSYLKALTIQPQRFVSMAILNPIKLTLEINHHSHTVMQPRAKEAEQRRLMGETAGFLWLIIVTSRLTTEDEHTVLGDRLSEVTHISLLPSLSCKKPVYTRCLSILQNFRRGWGGRPGPSLASVSLALPFSLLHISLIC